MLPRNIARMWLWRSPTYFGTHLIRHTILGIALCNCSLILSRLAALLNFFVICLDHLSKFVVKPLEIAPPRDFALHSPTDLHAYPRNRHHVPDEANGHAKEAAGASGLDAASTHGHKLTEGSLSSSAGNPCLLVFPWSNHYQF